MIKRDKVVHDFIAELTDMPDLYMASFDELKCLMDATDCIRKHKANAAALRECLREALEWVQDASPAVAAPWEERARELTKEG